MSIQLQKLPTEDFKSWLQRSTNEYIGDLVASGQNPAQASAQAKSTMDSAFLQGHPTADNAVFNVYHENLGVVGYLWVGTDTSEDPAAWWIWDIVIDSDQRGKGLGRRTMLLAEDYARSMGARTLGLNVFGFNTTALELYKSVGYETTSLKMRKEI